MTPKFCNPHLISHSEKLVARSEIYSCDDDEPYSENDEYLDSLRETLTHRILETFDVAPDSGRKRKRRKVAQDFFSGQEGEDEKIALFRLFSSSAPKPICLDPLPPPKTWFREPECEDGPEEARERHARALEVSVDSEFIVASSRLRYTNYKDHAVEAKASSSFSPAPILLLERRQAPRSTRPPCQDYKLSYPYDQAAVPSVTPSLALVGTVEISDDAGAKATRKRKRVRGRGKSIQRSQPTFWSPRPNMDGTCRGYAFGYPSSLLGDDNRGAHYFRDSMKKGVESFVVT